MQEKCQTWNRWELLVFTHRFKYSINNCGLDHSGLPAPWQEPEVRVAFAVVAHLGKQAESASTFCTLIKKKINVSSCLSLVQVFMSDTDKTVQTG